MLKVLAHRGCWSKPQEGNSIAALLRALDQSWGIEFDVRDQGQELVISHDMPRSESVLLRTFFAQLTSQQKDNCFAINIKSDGLSGGLLQLLKEYRIENYFVFDMSVPDTRSYLNEKINVFSRFSEEEKAPAFADCVSGFWVDSFSAEGVDLVEARSLLSFGKSLAVVSPELHGYPYLDKWKQLKNFIKDYGDIICGDVYLCTDEPEHADRFFKATL